MHPDTTGQHVQGGFIGWMLGLILILVSGWGFIALVAFLANTFKIGIGLDVVAAIASGLSLCFFLALERNLWLSRFMALRLGPKSSPIKEALLLWLLGIPGLLFRSTVPRETVAQSAPAPRPSATQPEKEKSAPPETQDGFREIVETIVFVVVLVLLLKAFLAEAFVIPTGSMATTLLGYHRDVQCPKCGYTFRINMSEQADPDRRNPPQPITGCTCPNCFLAFSLSGFPRVEEAPQP